MPERLPDPEMDQVLGVRPRTCVPGCIDLVRLPEHNSQGVVPCVFPFPLSFEGFVGADECMRYHLEIVSDEFISKTCQVFEVAWDGQWNDDMDNMQQHLTVREVTKKG